jgi:hypothetical protein
MPTILDGAAIAAAIKQEVAQEVKLLAGQGVRPGLAAVLVGNLAASEIYVRSKVRTCAELGLFSELITPPETVTTEEMLDLVAALNARDEIDGILIQLPLPRQVDTKALLAAAFPSPASTPWWWAAATLWASPRPCCCSTRTPPSPSATPKLETSRRSPARPTSWWPPSAAPASSPRRWSPPAQR